MKKFLFSVMALFAAITMSVAQTALPYSTGFEDATDNALWTFDNGTNVNAWVIDEATNNGGSKALYVSNDEGVSNAYSTSGAQLSVAYRTFAFDATSYNISFDWKGQGESTWDMMQVLLIPDSITPAAAASSSATWNGVTVSRTTAASTIEAAGWFRANCPTPYQASSPFIFSMHSDWDNVPFSVNIPEAGNYKMVFVWLNDGSTGTQPPAAVDNLNIAAKLCGDMGAISIESITTSGAVIGFEAISADQYQVVVADASINPEDAEAASHIVYNVTDATVSRTVSDLAGNTMYYVYVRAICGANNGMWASATFRTDCGLTAIPYTEGFEDMEKGSSSSAAPACWALLNANDGTYPYIFVNNSSSYVKSGSKSLYFQSSSSRYGYVILPIMNAPLNTLKIAFSHKEESATSSGLLDLGYMTDITDAESFVSITQYTRSTSWQDEETMLNSIPAEVAATARLAFRYGGASNNYYMGIDDITIDVLPSCIKPANVTVSNQTTTTAEINCTPGANETAWTVRYRVDTTENWTVATASTTMPYTLTGLTANTAYEVQVAAVCSENETSDWTNLVPFRTACDVEQLPYEDSFENDIFCWTVGNMQSASSSYIPTAYSGTTYAHTGSYCLRFNAYKTSSINADSAYAVLPAMDYGAEGIAAYRLRFYARNAGTTASYNTHLYVGTLVDRNDMSSFTLVQDLLVEGTTYAQYEVSFANYTGEGQYIVLLATIDQASTSSYRYGSFYVDDLTVDLIPNCLRPTDVTVTNITATGAEINCVAGASETAWTVRYKAADAEEWTVAVASTEMPYALTGLAANKAYMVEVAAVCSETETSEWTEAVNFRTTCGVEAVPYNDGFENGIYCWTVGNMQSTSTSYIPSAYNSSTYAHDGNYSLRMNAYKSSTTNADSAYAILPALNYGVKGLNGYTLKFYARQSSTSTYYSYYNHLLIGVVSDPADMSTFTLVQDVEVTGTSYTFHEIPFSAYTGEGQYITILGVIDPNSEASTRYGSFYVDDLSVEPTPACQPLASITAVPARTKIEVTLNPKAGLELAAAYDLVCAATELDAEALEAAEKTVVTESPYTITGLERETPYYIYVRANCGQEDGVSAWVSQQVTTKNIGPDCSDVTPQIIRTGDGTTAVDYVMWSSYYNRTFSQQIYTAEEMTAAGLTPGYISKVAFQYAFSSAYSKTVTLYMGLTDMSEFASTSFLTLPEVSEATPINFETAGAWYEIELNNPLYWDGVSNIVVGAMSRGTNYSPNGSQMFRGGTTTGNCALYSRADSSDPSMTTGTRTTNRADIRFTICPLGTACPAVTDMAIELVGDGTTEARVNWTTADADYLSSYDLLLSTTEVTDFSEVTPTATGILPTAISYDLPNLTAETHYYVYLRANCMADGHNEGSSEWVGVDTTMNADCAAPNTLVTEMVGLNDVKASWNLAFPDQPMAFRYILSITELDADGIAGATPIDVDSNVIEIADLLYDQEYHLYVAAACGNSTSDYISTNFTTYAQCAPVQSLTAARVEHNRVVLSWVKNPFGTETAYEVGLVGEESNALTVSDQSAMLIGLTPETAYTAYVKAICSETSESAVATVQFTTGTQPGNCKAIGTGTTSGNMPVTNYDYAYTQMIYTADNFEITGNIVSMQLKRSSYANVMNNMKVYIGTTDKSVFASSSDWVAAEDLTLVYQGDFEAGSAAAPNLDITFSTPFAYDGSSNIVVAISNGHGNWNSIQNFYYTSVTGTVLCRRADGNASYADHPGTAAGQTPQSNRTNIEFCFEQKACPDVTAMAISDLTPTSATATWEPMGSETSWNVYLSATELADMSGIVGTTVNEMRYEMSELLVDQDYWFYVQPVCTGADSWKVATFRTVATCFPPMGLSARDITATSAVVCWQDTNAVGNYTVLYGPAATFDLEEPASYETLQAGDTSLLIDGLLPYTNYAFVVRSNCDDMSSRFSAPATFKTGAGMPFEPVFETATLSSDWKLYNSLFNADTVLTSALAAGTKWSLVVGTDAIAGYHFKSNIYGTSVMGWLISPVLDLTGIEAGTGMILRFDAALCKYNAPTTAATGTDTDDKFAVIISKDGGLSWEKSNMTLWQDVEGADYKYHDIPLTGKTYFIDMTQYAGYNIAIAFYGESTVSGGDNDIHVGNISLNYGTYATYEEMTCQGEPFDKHGFVDASSDEAGIFSYEMYTPATETDVQHYKAMKLTVNPSMMETVELTVLYVGDHYVDQYIDTVVQLSDAEEGYYGFYEQNQYGCDSAWYVIFEEIREAEYIIEDTVLADGETIIWHEMTIDTAGVYYDTVRSELGGVMAYYELTVTATSPSTGIDTIETVEGNAVKVIINGNLYLVSDEQWYDATGRLTEDPRK